MNLSKLLQARQDAGKPVSIGLIGAGKYGTMFLAQARTTPGIHIVAVADRSIGRAAMQLRSCNWPADQYAASSFEDALRTGRTFLTDDADRLVTADGIDVVIEATGDPRTGIRLALATINAGKHIVMVNVEADVVAGPLLALKARQAGVVYSLAYGDQPAIVCEHVDWARACGFRVVAAGKGTRYLPKFHQSTPDTVFENLPGLIEIKDRSTINPKMFNSFVDGTKSAIEMVAIANAADLSSQTNGLAFPPADRFELANVLRPKHMGGSLEKSGVTECVSSLARNGEAIPLNLAHGTFVVVEAVDDNSYTRECFREYHMLPDETGQYAALYRPIHFSGLELGISAAWAALLRMPTGAPTCFNADVVATAKRGLKAGELLDGEGGFCVWGRQTPAAISLSEDYLPLGLAQDVKLVRDVPEGAAVRWSDVAIDAQDPIVAVRREMEKIFGPADFRAP